ncbi:conserved hypothetical protein [Desulfofarcimen acetoxidans DSM 771]|jgi:hypothetical protein|uniref:PBS lyase HEAT domain protein repeat-containing protein n=1 Tax=Desulfofarcimen acetoxidans (strain ATCC 49208 / DSM 771 / KCTC 5769 / VKM B-1644 / 5575) TaxID=485916 RepID=C8W5Q3_DESAS|nr:DVU0298 family protein [Desulfofarcimen acetoxidans]ACV64053.1 conserved hypothetical protein [Desulfofarcimen acetoxidans DSM 771]
MASKNEIIALLLAQNYEQLANLVSQKRGLLQYLQRLLYNRGELICWRAIEGIGWVADRLAGEDPEFVRDMLRRQMWSANDESGGIGWSAPEVMGEIIYHRPQMFQEFASIVISFLDETMLRRGVVWAAGRMAQALPELVKEAVPELSSLLEDPDPVIRGYTVRFLSIMGEQIDPVKLQMLAADEGVLHVYENGVLTETTVGSLAGAMKMLQ